MYEYHCFYVYQSITIDKHVIVFSSTFSGFVTDHINLLQDHSKLYHYLAVFEDDSKRKIAMENRRTQLLQPLLTSLNRTAFDNLHKQVSYYFGRDGLYLF